MSTSKFVSTPESNLTHDMEPQFALFAELPKEIQIRIWELTLEVPRVIELGQTRERWLCRKRVVIKADFWAQIQMTSNSDRTTLVPAALETCITSREVALAYYGQLGPTTRSWFNPQIDTLYIGRDWTFMKGLPHWREMICRNSEIRHVAFHLLTARSRQDFFCVAEVALKSHVKDVSFVVGVEMMSPSSSDGVLPRFTCVDQGDIVQNAELRPIGKFFRDAQQYIMTEAWNTHDFFFRRRGYFPDEESQPCAWKMPKMRLLIEDEAQARKTRKDNCLRRELAAIRKAEADAVPQTIDPTTIDWNWTPPHDQFCPCPYCY